MPVETKKLVFADLSEKFIRRFHSHYKKGGENECWDWTRCKGHKGYGQTFVNGDTRLSHRIAYLIANGSIPDDKPIIRHTCDNPSCVNPAHLLCGTVADNTHDKVSRNRHPVGQESPHATLTEKEVQEIGSLYKNGHSQVSLSKRFGISQPSISRMVNKKSWKHVA